MACDGIAGGSIGVHLGGHDNIVNKFKQHDGEDEGAIITQGINQKNDFASNMSPEFREATEKKPGGIFT